MSKLDLTWHDVLRKKGFDDSTSESLIGFISWEKDNIYPNLGKEITDVLTDYRGKVIAKDVLSNKYGDQGILFLNANLPEKTIKNMFEAIMEYEHEDVYK